MVRQAAVAESVVLLSADGRAVGVLPKAQTHGPDTPLHLAFSVYVFDPAGRLLVTQRALHKQTWPGVWSNTCCGHPAPGEGVGAAVRRRLVQELGVDVAAVDCVLPGFRYRAVMADGVVENEVCPVFRAAYAGEPAPDPAEVAAAVWEPWPAFAASVLRGRDVSPWCRLQVADLVALGPDPFGWPARDLDESGWLAPGPGG